MALIDKLLLRNPEETARAEAKREFRRLMPSRGRISEIAQCGITAYYDKKFGRFEPAHDRWDGSHASTLQANPQLRRIDVIADNMFKGGRFSLNEIGDVRSKDPPHDYEGTMALARLTDRRDMMVAMLILDIGSEVRFSKLRVATVTGHDFMVRLSTRDHGMIVGPNTLFSRQFPETVHERGAEGSRVFHTLLETLDAIERILAIKPE